MSHDQTSVRPVVFARWPLGAVPTLTVIKGSATGKVFTLREAEALIGRDDDAAIQLRDRGVSRRHAKLVRASDEIVNILDLGSTNGTFVNGVRIDLSLLREGDRVHVGPDAILRFSYVEAEADPAPPAPQLTQRQLAVARLVTAGLTNAEVAERLGLSLRTVTTHLDHIYARLKINSRAALARHITERGLLDPEEPGGA
ncbi:MAG: FHA domain-containing protein [Nannocystaceae bacterium]